MFACDPWLPTLLDEPLLVLLGRVASIAAWFVVEVVLWIKDFLKAGCSMCVDLHVVLVQGALPGFCMLVIDGVGPLPCCQCCVPLSSPSVWLVRRRIGCALVLADVKWCNSLVCLLCLPLGEIMEPLAFFWAGPCFPNEPNCAMTVTGVWTNCARVRRPWKSALALVRGPLAMPVMVPFRSIS